MTVRPADLAHGLSEGAVLEDATQEMDAAVATKNSPLSSSQTFVFTRAAIMLS